MVRSDEVATLGGPIPVRVAEGEGRGAAVLFAPSAFGLAADVVVQMEELAADASMVVGVDPFFRGDAGPAAYTDMPRILARLQALDRAGYLADLRAVLAWMRTVNPDRKVVVVGVCFGGPFALHLAADGLADAIVMWHPSRLEQHLGRAAEAKVPMRLHFGELDPFVPPPTVDAARAAFADHDDVRVVVHEGATHGFSHPDAPAYQRDAERAGVASVRELVRTI